MRNPQKPQGKQTKKESKIKLLIWGEGDYREALMKRCDELGLDNIVFKGRVEKKYIPYIVSRADVNLMHGKITGLLRFGISLNKLFDYLAAGRPIFSDLYTEYDLVAPIGCGNMGKMQKNWQKNLIIKSLRIRWSSYFWRYAESERVTFKKDRREIN